LPRAGGSINSLSAGKSLTISGPVVESIEKAHDGRGRGPIWGIQGNTVGNGKCPRCGRSIGSVGSAICPACLAAPGMSSPQALLSARLASFSPLVTSLLKDADRERAAQTLLQKLDPSVTPDLVQLIRAECDVTANGKELLSELSGKHIDNWGPRPTSASFAAAKILAALGDPRAQDVFQLLLTASQPELRLLAAEGLSRLGQVQWKQLVKGEEGDYLRLAQAGDPQACQILCLGLHHTDYTSAKSSCDALKKVGPKAVDPLVASLGEGKHFTVRQLAAGTLGGIGDRRAIAPLVQALKDPQQYVAGEAAVALGQLRTAEAYEPISDMLTLDTERGRGCAQQVCQALGLLGDHRATRSLMQVMRSDVYDYAFAATRALGQLADPESVGGLSDLLGEPTMDLAAKFANNPVMKAFIAVLRMGIPGGSDGRIPGRHKAEAESIRAEAARSLGRIGGNAAVEALTARTADDSREVREAAREALVEIATATRIAEFVHGAMRRQVSATMSFAELPRLLDTLHNAHAQAYPNVDLGKVGAELEAAFAFRCPGCGPMDVRTILLAQVVTYMRATSPHIATIIPDEIASVAVGQCPGCGCSEVTVNYDPTRLRSIVPLSE
jgi:HEAT repeat protein